MIAKNHFEDCPYNCNESGMLLDSSQGKLVPCPYCSKKKKELLAQGFVESVEDEQVPIGDALGIQSNYLSTNFVYEAVIPDGERIFIDQESLDWQSEVAEKMFLDLTVGTLPEQSICFGISVKGAIDKFAYPMLAKAYLANLKVSRLISCTEFSRLVFKMSDEVDEFYDSDFLIMLINDGCTFADVSAAKGLMQSRALKGKPTVFITTWNIEACSGLLGFKEDASYFLAKPVFIKYKSSKGHSRYVNGLLGVENQTLTQQEDGGFGVSLSDL